MTCLSDHRQRAQRTTTLSDRRARARTIAQRRLHPENSRPPGRSRLAATNCGDNTTCGERRHPFRVETHRGVHQPRAMCHGVEFAAVRVDELAQSVARMWRCSCRKDAAGGKRPRQVERCGPGEWPPLGGDRATRYGARVRVSVRRRDPGSPGGIRGPC